MLFKKILSFALAAAMVSALPAFPAINGTKVIAADSAAAESGDFSLLTSEYEVAVGNTVQIAYSGSANGLMTQIDNPFIISDDATGLVIKGLRTGSSGVSFFSGGKEFKALITVVPNPDITDVCDICVANIIAQVICSFAAPLKAHIVPGGLFICSGIIAEREEDVRSALLAAGYEILETVHRGEWVAFLARRPE